MISLNGFNEQIVTFATASTLTAGIPVVMSADNTVAAAENNGVFIGICNSSSEDAAAVIVNGYVELPYSGTAPSLGISTVAANGNGGITSSATGRKVTVTSVDETAGTVGMIL